MRFARTLWLLLVLAAFLAVGPWALVVALVVTPAVCLAVPPVRRALRPRWRPVLVFLALVGAVAAVVAVVPDGRLPIPPGGGLLVTPAYVGGEATPRPIDLTVPQHPGLAANGDSSMHNDGWATDVYAGPGPLGRDPEVDSAWYGVKECATLAFDTRGRMVALCGSVDGPEMHVVDLETMDPVDTLSLPGRTGQNGKRPWEDLCGGAYFYLDEADVAYVGTTVRTIAVVDTGDLEQVATIDLTDEIPDDDCLVALMPDWQGVGTWWVTQDGRVGHVTDDGASSAVDLGEEIANSVSVDQDGLYVVTVDAFYKLALDEEGLATTLWRTAYTNSGTDKPGQLSAGSGTTPTVLPSGLVAITDNAEPRMNVQFYDAATGELACEAPVFGAGESATDNSVAMVGESSVVVENNYGYASPVSTVLGRGVPGGFARVDAVEAAPGAWACEVAWTNDVVGPSTVPKVSLETGLVYAYSVRPNRWGVHAWYVTAMDAVTGEEVFAVRVGIGLMFNNHGAPVTLSPDGSLYVPTLTGMVRVRDGE